MNEGNRGSLICLGVGITIGAHITPIARHALKSADIVFAASSDSLFELWLKDIHPNVVSLQQYYNKGKSRKITYQEMTEALLTPVRQGKKAVAAFYGHPGVFVNPSHKAILQAKAEGFEAIMLPGISAADCLYADLGIDPGKYGCQHFEASQFMFYQRNIDPTAYLILWQVMAAGDKSHTQLNKNEQHLLELTDLLAEDFPLDHKVIVYEAASNAVENAIQLTCKLSELSVQQLSQKSTLIIPPSKKLIPRKKKQKHSLKVIN
ncbi:MAG: hypothetical protein HWE27_05820 [Gammaproteobacteria bacterium]|nr:hypothetical protein [Gammaproteobacteria bacterium]